MSADRNRLFSRRSRVWLVWLALLLPAAQAAATWHTFSVAPADGADRHGSGRAALHSVHCDLCLTAAALSGSASTTIAPDTPSPTGRHESPRAISGSAHTVAPAWPYRSRAPPLARN